MSRLFSLSLLLVAALIVGCAETPATDGPPTGDASAEAPAEESSTPEESAAPEESATEADPDSSASAPAAGEAKTVALTPENTKVEFIGHHTDRSKPSHDCSFEKFSGEAVVDGGLKSVKVEIDVASIKTPSDKLTTHLKSADFFDVNNYPTATFTSTEIKDNGDGTVEITGDLNMLDKTESVTFPATVSTDGKLALKAEFEIDRTRWGMDFGTENVEKEVPMTITIDG